MTDHGVITMRKGMRYSATGNNVGNRQSFRNCATSQAWQKGMIESARVEQTFVEPASVYRAGEARARLDFTSNSEFNLELQCDHDALWELRAITRRTTGFGVSRRMSILVRTMSEEIPFSTQQRS